MLKLPVNNSNSKQISRYVSIVFLVCKLTLMEFREQEESKIYLTPIWIFDINKTI